MAIRCFFEKNAEPVTPCAITALTSLCKEIFIKCIRFLLTLCYFCCSHSSLMKTMPIQQIYMFSYFNLVTTKTPGLENFLPFFYTAQLTWYYFFYLSFFHTKHFQKYHSWKFLLNWMYFASARKPPDISCRISRLTRDQFRHSVTNSNELQHVKTIFFFFTLRAW